MSPDELEDEKHCIQKALLQFEKKFGRPVRILYHVYCVMTREFKHSLTIIM